MKRHFIISSMLALGMGIAQAQTQPMQPAPMQGGSNDPRQGMQQQSTPPAAGQGMGTGATDQAAAQSFKGCLNGSAGSWTLTSDKGKSMNLSGTDNQLSPYQGQEVRIQGVQASDGSITVSSVDKISEACENQAASNSGAQSTSTSQNDMNSQSSTSNASTTSQSTTATTPSSSDKMSQSTQAPAASTTPDNSSTANSQTSSTSSSAPAATTPPVSNQTPANTVGSGQTGQSSAQSSTSSTDQNAASSTSNSGQNADQGVRKYSDMDQNAGNNASSKLPQTASPLPLLGLLGLGSLVTGIVSRRKK